ncbi:mechanosensitive ion channel [Paracoccus sp. R12_1]|jgi:small-conductance mechanosensitive channel|uniref:mechanosensitive ion channel family protein n=1 Tax=unclassified Paracoccus (in: a-proteobacteria) TaxID=2688777 RepID=UPI001ADB0632|nr:MULTISPECIES: mechanosensitive ion channel domain-containing protein [unclassified Paracoccus (in: a-proteobacteria)]MBO9454795.1 mechanosensitive ion channel [Paracoccus sp. R12_2]MBO9485517.1 mechanosensitive ion channel [Paracoccus sp. R12_1]
MEELNPEVIDAAQGLWYRISLFVDMLLIPSRMYQLPAIAGLVLISWLIARLLSPRLTGWLRSRENWPKWRLRVGLLIDRRLTLIVFTILAWAVVLVMREVTYSFRSQVIELAATIAAAWVGIFFLMRVITNRFLRRIVSWAAWIWVTLHLLNLTEPAAAFLESIAISLGDFRLSALTVLKALAITGLMIAGARMLSRVITGRLSQNDDISPTMRVLTAKLLQIFLFSLAIIVGLKAVGFDLTGLAVFSGAVGVGLGFGLQKVVSNLVSGVIILLDKSIKPGDVISLGDTFGWIEELGARYVSVVTRDGKEYLIPNEDLVTGQVVNWSHTNNFVRLDIPFGTSYGDDPHKVSEIAINAALSVKRVLAQRKPVCWVTGFGDSSVDYVLRFWIGDAQGGLTNVRGQVYLALWDAFREHGVSIPFPQREVRLLNDQIAIRQHGGGRADGASPESVTGD